ncbi:hypothetical protein K438DRAFT_1789678 [Mycena galopus ATCC 62051]|nr:hypothetical protein K438DRAFT_1789678 [Mycena galopus ATCC 62051]
MGFWSILLLHHVRFSCGWALVHTIVKRGSHIRSQIITACRTLFAPPYKFNQTSTSTASIKDFDASTGYGENSILANIRKEKIFKKKTSSGVVFASHFDPYPHCNSEYSTGKFVAAEFSEKEMGKNYATHLNDVKHWADMNKTVVDRLRHEWFTRAMGSFAMGLSDPGTHLAEAHEDALRAELAGRTGDTNSESENA